MKITPREKRRHAASRFARSTIPEEKWGTTRSLTILRSLYVVADMRVFCVITVLTCLLSMFQREYYATHQCFLSHRSLYIAMWKVTDGEQGVNGIEPWLLNIQVGFSLSMCLLLCSSPFLGL